MKRHSNGVAISPSTSTTTVICRLGAGSPVTHDGGGFPLRPLRVDPAPSVLPAFDVPPDP